MAKRTTAATSTATASKRKSAPVAAKTATSSAGSFKDFISNPAVKYVAGGIASALLTKFVTKLSEKYPEITRLLTENLDSIENRLNEFKNSNSDSEESVARH